MDMVKVLSDLVTADGVTGNEIAVGEVVRGYFERFTPDVTRSTLGNVYARIGTGKPVLLVMAHMDEVGMMVTDVEENGMLRLRSAAGVDPRVLPGSEVLVFGKKVMPAVVGAIPPHLLGEERNEAYKMDDLVCDAGVSPETARELFAPGDFVTYAPLPPLELQNGRVASKTHDDRALVTVMIEAMELLQRRKIDCTVVFCASVQEERGGAGAITASNGLRPDVAIAMDVCHPFNKTEIDKLSLTTGSNIHPKIFEKLTALADARRIPYEIDACMGATGTDAWDIQIQSGGIPTGLISIPLKYMHTSVEVADMKMLKNCAELIVEYAASLSADWEAQLCWDD